MPPNSKNRIKGQKQRVKGHDIPEMSNYAKIIVGIRIKGKDIMLKITVIDDEKEYIELIRQTIDNWLMEKGCQGEIDCFDNAEDFKGQIEAGRCYDIYFMDIEMPRKTGLEAAAILHEQLPDTHIVFLTAYDRFDYAVGALRTGGREYLLKPVSETTLRETLRKFFHVEHEPEKDASPFETSLRVWIAQHYTEDITLDDAAESMGMSTFYFSRQVKVLTGHTFLEYLTAYRIDKAKDLLRSTDMSVSDIGHSAGYSESNYFLRVFKRVTGMTPSTYRNQVKDEGK